MLMTTDVQVRLASANDLPSVKAFDEFEHVNTDLINAGEIYIATVGDQPRAYAWFNYSFYWRGYTVAVVVHPDHRRRGLATALMRHLDAICQTPKIFISTGLSNIAMQTTIQRCGYQLTGVVENLGPDPELIYFKRLIRP
jgi:GNAT superfamily N-acetyltransferase